MRVKFGKLIFSIQRVELCPRCERNEAFEQGPFGPLLCDDCFESLQLTDEPMQDWNLAEAEDH